MQAAEAHTVFQTPVPFIAAALFDGLAGATSVAIAVSGGSDSMALLRLAHEQRLPGLVALTVDHGLRSESAAEAQRVARWCAELGVEHHILQWEGAKPSTGVQAKARVARYDALTAFCRARGITTLLTGHTLDDQAETFVMRAARTDSPAALAGIWPETDWNGVRVVRPLLTTRRDALQAWLTSNGQGWIEDPSNDDPRFERVRVRQSLDTAAIEPLGARAEAARREFLKQDAVSSHWIAEHVRQKPESHLIVDRAHLLALPQSAQASVLARLVRNVGCGGALMAREVDRLVAAIHSPQRRTLGGAVIAVRRQDVIFARETGRIAKSWTKIGPDGDVLWDGRFRVFGPVGADVGAVGWVQGLKRPDHLPGYVHASCPVVRHNGQFVAPEPGQQGAEISATLL